MSALMPCFMLESNGSMAADLRPPPGNLNMSGTIIPRAIQGDHLSNVRSTIHWSTCNAHLGLQQQPADCMLSGIAHEFICNIGMLAELLATVQGVEHTGSCHILFGLPGRNQGQQVTWDQGLLEQGEGFISLASGQCQLCFINGDKAILRVPLELSAGILQHLCRRHRSQTGVSTA